MNDKTMRAALVTQPDGPFQTVALPRPVVREGEVLVRVLASALNPLDGKVHTGQAPHARQPLPAVLGIEMAGVVEAVGPGAPWVPGDRVMGMVGGVGGRQGTLAEFVAVDARLLAPLPRGWAPREAATLPLAFITAWEGLVDRARIQAGQTVLVQAGAGGVGAFAVQLALAQGAVVWATGRPAHRALIEGLGARFLPLDQPGATKGIGFDIVFDTLGGAFLDQSFQLVNPFGHVVSCLGWGTHSLAPLSFKGATYSGVFTLEPLLSGRNLESMGAILGHAARLAEGKALRPRLAPQRFGLDTVNDAFALLNAHTGSGRVVVDIG